MFCHNCGTKLEEGDLFCPECGTRVEQKTPKEQKDPGINRNSAQGNPQLGNSWNSPQGNPQPGNSWNSAQGNPQPGNNWNGSQGNFWQEPNWSSPQGNSQPENNWEGLGAGTQSDPDLYQEPEEFRRQEKRRAQKEAQKKRNQTLTLALLGVAIVVLTGAVIFGVWMLTRPESEEDYTAPQVAASPTEEPEDGGKGQAEEKVTVTASPTPTATPTEEPTPTLAPVTVVTAAPTPTPEAAGDYIFPDSNSRYLSYEEVAAKGQQELVYARNEIFARHGRKFKSAELQAYFNSKSWYTPIYEADEFTTALQDRLFDDYEKENVKQITKVEKDKGYTS